MVAPLVVDTYPDDSFGNGEGGWSGAIQRLVLAGRPWCGLILKATEGTYYPKNNLHARDWFLDNWIRARIYAGVRYGKDWFRGAMHYVRVGEDGIAQADNLLSLVDEAGGWGDGDLWPMLDLESAENPPDATAQQIIDTVVPMAQKIRAATGMTPMLYGNVYPAERGVRDYLGCGTLTVPRYTPTLPAEIYQRIGWLLARPPQMPTVWGWQYSGDPEGGKLAGYPTKCPMSATENADITAIIVDDDFDQALAWTAANRTAQPADPMFVGGLPRP